MFLTLNYPNGNGTQYDMFRYPAGEVQVRLKEHTIDLLKSKHTDSVHLIARITNGEIMELAQLIDAIDHASGTKHITLTLPYLPYGRADRRFTNGDCHGLRVFLWQLGQMVDEIVTLDAHSDKSDTLCMITEIHFTNVSPMPIVNQVINKLDGTTDIGTTVITTGILLPDAGAGRYGIRTDLIASKKRDPETGKLLGFTVPAKEEFKCDNVLIVDDICDGGGTFIGIADQMKDYGLDLYLYVTHGIFSKGFSELEKRFKHIYTTDSFTTDLLEDSEITEGSENLTVIPCMPTILEGINNRSLRLAQGGK